MKLALFTPLNPQPTGIADYTEELLPYLAEGAEIALFVEGVEASNREIATRFTCFDYARDPAALGELERYDAVLYQMGNDHRYHAGIYDVARSYPGIVVLHDFALQNFFLGLARARGDMNIYLDEIEACHGVGLRRETEAAIARGEHPPLAAAPLDYPLNPRLVNGAEAVIVHSAWSRQRLARSAPAVPVNLIYPGIPRSAVKDSTPRPHGHTIQLASFGHVTPDKGLEQAFGALRSLAPHYDFHYTLVGALNRYYDIQQLIEKYGLRPRVSLTDYVSLAEFERRVAATDIAINLRTRTAGEASGSLCRIMAAGVPSLVSNAGWFAELPDDTVVKIDLHEGMAAQLETFLHALMQDPPLRARIGENARRHMLSAHSIEQSAAGYLSFIRQVIARRARQHRPRQFTHTSHVAPVETKSTPVLSDEQQAETNGIVIGLTRAAETPARHNRLPKFEGIDYKRAAIEYPQRLDAERHHYLLTKPFYNLANKPPQHTGDGLDAETYRHFCDFANLTAALALPSGSRILDVGCGSGWLSEYLARLGYQVTGIDISPDLIALSRERVSKVPFHVDHQTPLASRFLTHDIERAPLEEQFDAVVCYDSLHHFVDEQAVMRHLSASVRHGGLLFIMEGDNPPDESATAEELRDVMREFGTLESPFDPAYLRALLNAHGFAVIGDYVSLNGLFERAAVADGQLRVTPPEVNYLLCKKVVADDSADVVPDSRRPGLLAAAITLSENWNEQVEPGERVSVALRIENTGDTLWLNGDGNRRGAVMPAVKLIDPASGAVLVERHGEPPLPRVLAPGESALIKMELPQPPAPGEYQVKIDLVAQHVAWFEERGSRPLVLRLVLSGS